MVSVIVPNYNYARFLKQRIDSVLNQSYQDFELIILDDCSTDNSKTIIEQYRNHPKVSQIVYNEKNSGSTFKQWEKGILLAKGQYVWIAESDDWAEHDFLEKLLEKFTIDSEIGLVYCNSNRFVNELFKDTLSDIKIQILENNKWKYDYIHDGKFELYDSLVLCCSINNASAVLFKKEVLLEANPFNVELKYLGDWYCYLKIAFISKIAYLNKTLNNYRDHSDNISKKATLENNHLREYFLIYHWIQKNLNPKNKRLVYCYFEGYTKHSFSLSDILLKKQYLALFKISSNLFFRMIQYRIKDRIIILLKNIKRKVII